MLHYKQELLYTIQQGYERACFETPLNIKRFVIVIQHSYPILSLPSSVQKADFFCSINLQLPFRGEIQTRQIIRHKVWDSDNFLFLCVLVNVNVNDAFINF